MILRARTMHVLLVCIILLGLCLGQRPKAAEVAPEVTLIPGTYLSTAYLQRLRETKSPLLAAGSRPINLILIEVLDDAGTLYVKTIYYFHEGGPVLYLARDSGVSIAMRMGADLSQLTLRVQAADRLIFGLKRDDLAEFVRIAGGLDLLLREVVIAGRYRNAAGELFEFTPSGMVITPQGSFAYEVGADHAPYRFDYIVDPQRHLFFKLVRQGCVIDLHALPDWQDGHGPTDGSDAKLWQSLRAENCTDDSAR